MSLPMMQTTTGEVFPYVVQDGMNRLLMALPPSADRSGLPEWSAMGKPQLAMEDWKPFDRTDPRIKILDQNGHGSCVGHGACTSFTFSHLKMGGGRNDFSPCFVYGLGNGGRDAGMQVSEAMRILMETGICLDAEVPEGMIWKRDFPAQSFETAKRFRIVEAYRLNDFLSLGTAVQLGYDVAFGILVGNGFTSLDSEGVPGVGGSGGHCLASANGMKKSSRWGWLVKTQNSWGTRYGQRGYCWLSKSHYEAGGYLDAYAIRVVSHDPKARVA